MIVACVCGGVIEAVVAAVLLVAWTCHRGIRALARRWMR